MKNTKPATLKEPNPLFTLVQPRDESMAKKGYFFTGYYYIGTDGIPHPTYSSNIETCAVIPSKASFGELLKALFSLIEQDPDLLFDKTSWENL